MEPPDIGTFLRLRSDEYLITRADEYLRVYATDTVAEERIGNFSKSEFLRLRLMGLI